MALFLSILQIVLVEEVGGKLLGIRSDIPALAFIDALFDKTFQPSQCLIAFLQIAHKVLHGLVYHSFSVQLYGHVGHQVQLSCQIAHHILIERVYGLNAEARIVMDDVLEGYTRLLANGVYRHLSIQTFVDTFQITIRGMVIGGQSVELLNDAFLHLCSSLIREGHSQYVPVCQRILHQELDVFHCQCICLSASSRCFVYY